MTSSHRNSILVEDATIVHHLSYPGEQYVLRLHSPEISAISNPGSFVHLQCDSQLAMRRPFSIMRADPTHGWIEILYKNVGAGTAFLSHKQAGQSLSLMGPIGNVFTMNPDRPRKLLMGGGVGIPPMIFLADSLRSNPAATTLVLMGSEVPFPFEPRPSTILIPGIPEGVIACMPLLEDWGIASRLTSQQGYSGCYDGFITSLARDWLNNLNAEELAEVEMFACGPHAMLHATAELAGEFAIPCQVSLEEYMACAVGGCAGCTVLLKQESGLVMKRVCVDGPVFQADQVQWAS